MAQPGTSPASSPELSHSQNGVHKSSSSILDEVRDEARYSVRTLEAHKGHRNLLIRACCAFSQMLISLYLFQIKVKDPLIVAAILQFGSSLTLLVQWRKGDPRMFLGRACCNWGMCILAIMSAYCGKAWLHDEEKCSQKAWNDDRAILPVLHVLGAFRLIANGLSLSCQFMFPHRMFLGHGNEQLFYRGCIQATGVPLHIVRFVVKYIQRDDFPLKEETHELLGHWLRVVVITISSWSLFHQWWHTGEGHTGHPMSDAWEHLRKKGNKIMDSLESMHSVAEDFRKLKRSASDLASKVAHAAADAIHHHQHASESPQASVAQGKTEHPADANNQVIGKQIEQI